MNDASRYRIASILFGVAAVAFAIGVLLSLIFDGIGWGSAIFVIASGSASLTSSICYRRLRVERSQSS